MTRPSAESTELVDIPVSLIPQVERFISQGGVGVPFYESAVPGGFPSPAQDSSSRPVNILSMIVPHPDQTILVRVPDGSLEEEGVFEDDILIAERETLPKAGEIILARIDGEVCISRFDGFFRETLEITAVVRYRIHTLYGKQFF